MREREDACVRERESHRLMCERENILSCVREKEYGEEKERKMGFFFLM